MSEFKQYRRIQIVEMRPVTGYDIDNYIKHAGELIVMNGEKVVKVSISVEDLANGSPKIGDMIARNPKNHDDQWLVAEQYFKDNFEPISPIEWLENKLIELRKHAVVGQSEQLKCEHKGRRTATELVEYCEDCKKILFHP